jgi:acetyl esterase
MARRAPAGAFFETGHSEMDAATAPTSHDVSEEDIEYRRIDGEPLLARLYRPRGTGPFPAVGGVHGGAWTSGDRSNNVAIDRALAAAGVVVAALDFRIAPRAPYPASIADVNAGLRWLKAHASELRSRADWVGAVGSSSGGHQMLLAVMRPRDPRYATAAPELAGLDAEVGYAVACWPIADPLARYRMAQARDNARLVQAHTDFFRTEEAMTEANPQLLLERGEKASLPSLLILQGTKDDNVTPDMAQRLATAWRGAGGRARLETFADEPHTFVTKDPGSAASLRAIALLREFVLRRGG